MQGPHWEAGPRRKGKKSKRLARTIEGEGSLGSEGEGARNTHVIREKHCRGKKRAELHKIRRVYGEVMLNL